MVVVGAGRIGRALLRGAPHDVTLLDRTTGWNALDREPGEPVVLAVRNDDLDSVLARVPERRRSDLVFVQNGALREFLADRALAAATRGVLYVLAEREAAYEGDTRTPPIARTSFFSGRHAPRVADVFARAGMPALVVDRDAFGERELEKLVWLAAYGPLCEALALPVGAVGEAVPDALVALVAELGTVVARAWDVPVPDTLLERAVAWSDAIPHYRAAVKEWPWRNGWIATQATRLGLPTAHHRRWLTAAGH
jgi:ketopantoate reductase